MAKSEDIDNLLKGIDKRTKKYKRTKEYLESRARPGEVKTVTISHKDHDGKALNKNGGVSKKVTLTVGKCPCSICGHNWMWQCEDANCQCCSSACT